MVVFLFFLIMVLAFWHFAYEAILLPNFRLFLRYKLFEIRDELRNHHFIKTSKENQGAYIYLESSVNSAIAHLPSMSLAVIYSFSKELKANQELSKQLQKKREQFDTCDDKKIHELSDKLASIISIAILVNSGAWVPYLFPILIIASIFGLITSWIQNCKDLVQGLTLTPNHQVEKIMSSHNIYSY